MQQLLISRSNITVSKLYKKLAVRTIFRENCKLRNFAFYNFCQNLGFQPLEKTTLQLLRILHGIIIISRFVRRTTARAIFRKFSILQNFAFYNFCKSWFPILTRGFGNFALYHGIITTTKVLRKPEISHFTNFNRSLVYFPWIKSLTTLQLLKTLNGINMTPAFLKKESVDSLL